MHLDSTMLVTHRHTSSLKQQEAGLMTVDIEALKGYPKIFGNTDPLNILEYFSGVQTSSEYDSGIHIQGCDNAHNHISSGGVPLFGVNHLFGLFSVFNPSHYGRMSFSRSASGSSAANRLGGHIVMELLDTLAQNVKGEFTLGIMSSQGTLSFKAGRNSSFHISARQSYLDLLYGRWLKIGGNPMSYGFGDYNFTYHLEAGDNDRLWVDAYFGKDNAFLGAGNYNVDLESSWGNLMGAVHWEHKGNGYFLNQTLFASGYGVDASLVQGGSSLKVPSSIGAAGYKANVRWLDFTSGVNAIFYRTRPQAPEKDIDGNLSYPGPELQNAAEFDLYTDYSKSFADRILLKAGLKGSLYISPEKKVYPRLSPQISLSYNAYQWGGITLSYGIQHQFLFQTGLSNVGLPIDFWFMAGKHSLPQAAQSLSLGYDVTMLGDMLRLDVELFGKRLYNQVEYNGDLFDLLNSEYDLDRVLLKGDGMNYGLNVMLQKQSGNFTGWLSYSLGRALRTFDDPDYPSVYPASHERIQEFNAICSYEIAKWMFSGIFVYAGGTPFTAPESFYISSGNLMTQYGEYNSSRLRPYIRLDLSVNLCLRKDGRQENGINLSVYNVLARKNEVMWRLVMKDGKFSFSPMTSFMRAMPSISYYHKF